MTQSPVKIIFGAAGIGRGNTDEVNKELFEVLHKHNVKNVDTAYIYEGSEKKLTELGESSKFIIDTKVRMGPMRKQDVLDSMAESLERLGLSQVDIYYLHAPAKDTPYEDTLSGINQLYKEGKFERFGLSNYTASAVQEIYDLQKKNDGVLPTVYQGNYNAVSRLIEKDLFPVLRKLNIAFNAYSPIAGGFLVKSSESFRSNSIETGRFSATNRSEMIGKMYNTMYMKDSMLEALDEWEEVAKKEGVSKAALAYRWIAWHSALKGPEDGVIVGASKGSQLEETLSAIKAGPLSEEAVNGIEAIWKKVEKDAPVDNYESFMKPAMHL